MNEHSFLCVLYGIIKIDYFNIIVFHVRLFSFITARLPRSTGLVAHTVTCGCGLKPSTGGRFNGDDEH